MRTGLTIIFLLLAAVSYAGDYGRTSSSLDDYKAKQEASFKLMKDYVKDLPAEAKSLGMKNYMKNRQARDMQEREQPGSGMQAYADLYKRLKPELDKVSGLAELDKNGLLAEYSFALLFSDKSVEETDALFLSIVQDAAYKNNEERFKAFREALLINKEK